MPYTEVKTAADCHGKKIRVGDDVVYVGYGEVRGDYEKVPGPVRVVRIHRQGANGTILTTDPAPDPQYPHHFSCRASVTRRVARNA